MNRQDAKNAKGKEEKFHFGVLGVLAVRPFSRDST
jgi:hypothetical protein